VDAQHFCFHATVTGGLAMLAGVFFAVAPASGQINFTDVTNEAGVGMTEVLTEAAAWGDYDNDVDRKGWARFAHAVSAD